MRRTTKAVAALSVGSFVLVSSAGLLGGFGSLESATIASSTEAMGDVYGIDPVHTNVLFNIRHAGVTNFYGRFNTVSGSIDFDDSDFTKSSMSFEIPISSIDTNSKTRDGHLKDAEFFNARQFPKATFESASITKSSGGTYDLTGALTIHGVTNTVTAKVHDLRTGSFRDNDVMGFEARFEIQRSEFEIMKYLASDLSDNGPLGNTVEIIVAVEAVKQ